MVSTRAMHHRCTKIKHNTQVIDTQYWQKVPEGAISSL